METQTEDERSAGPLTLASSWDAACGALGRSLRVRGAQDADWDELLAPPAAGRDLVILRRSPKSPEQKPCFLSLSCGPSGGEEIVSVGILSSARNVEVYLGEEYCGTSRGRSVGNVLDTSEHEDIVLYKNFLNLESPARACKIKLLSFGEEPRVRVSHVAVLVRPAPAKPPASRPALGPSVDLERVHALLAAMGSTLSPGAQQLMSMVRFQQQHCPLAPQRCLPLGEQLQAVLGSAACKRVPGLRARAPSGACDRPPCAPAPPGPGPADGNAPLGERDPAAQAQPLPARGLQLATAFSPKRASDGPGAPAPELLPLLQGVCGQVRWLRGAHSEGGPGAGTAAQPGGARWEQVLSAQLERLERRLRDHLDARLRALQEHVDRQVALLAQALQSPGSPPPGAPPARCASGDRLSDGER